MTTRIYLDMRAAKSDGTYPLKVSIAHRGKTALIPLNVYLQPGAWDKRRQEVIGVPNKKALNAYIIRRKLEIDDALRELANDGKIAGQTITAVKEAIIAKIDPVAVHSVTFLEYYQAFTRKHENPRTREIYDAALEKMKAYDKRLKTRTFEDINKRWLDGFFLSMEKDSPSVNARNIHMRCIRAAFNDAIDEEVTAAYPFRRYKIRPEDTIKRSLTLQQLRDIFNAQVTGGDEFARKVFALHFMLIGINSIDLYRARLADIQDGRLVYKRAKSHRLYDIKVEPEAMDLINELTDGDLLIGKAAGYPDYRALAYYVSKHLKHLRAGLSSYWARHTWATMATSLRVSKETIRKALGHGSKDVTDIYINYERARVDKANRIVIDFVLNDIRPALDDIP